MKATVRLTSLKIDAYRGAECELSIPLDQPLNVIYGPNRKKPGTFIALRPSGETEKSVTGCRSLPRGRRTKMIVAE